MVCDRTAEFVVRTIRRDAGNGPDEPRQLTRNRGDHDLLQLALRYHVTISVAQPELRFPSNRAHRFRHNLYGCQLVAGYAGREAVTVGGFDKQGAGVNVAGFGDGANAALRAGGVFGRH